MDRRELIGVLLAACFTLTSAQEGGRLGLTSSPVDSLSQIQASFERLLHTITGNADVRAIIHSGPWAVETRQRLRSRSIKSQQSVRQDEYQGSLDVRRSLVPLWSLVLREQSTVVAGPTSIDLAELSQHRLLGGARVGQEGSISATGLAGWEWNRQQGRSDAGPTVSLQVETPDAVWEDMNIHGRGSWRSSDLGERTPSDGDVELVVQRNFGGLADYSLTASIRSQRRDLPTVNTSTVIGGPAGPPGLFRRDEDAIAVRNALWVAIAPDLRASIDAGWNDRRVERSFSIGSAAVLPLPTNIRQLQFDASSRLVWEPVRSWVHEAAMGFVRGEESHDVREQEGTDRSAIDEQRRQARRRSNQSQRAFLSIRSTLALDDATDVLASASSNILRYDTPDTLNTDDRDELLLTGSVEIGRRWNQWFSTHLALDAAVDHLVYLSRYQSANNVTVRTLRLMPLIVWRSSQGFRNALRAEVAASYTVYDFEDAVGGVHSYSYRQAMWSDSLIVPVGSNVWLEFSGSLRLFERGLLRWKEFRERPERSFKELAWWPRLRVRLWTGIGCAIGFRSFRQERTVIRDGIRHYDGAIGSSGPTVDVEAVWRSGVSVLLSGWRETQRSEARILDTISNLSIHVMAPL